MYCDDARLDLALWVGNDLDDRARIEELRRHVATCPHCRAKARALQASMGLLSSPDPDPTFDQVESLWPELDARIDYLEKTPKSPARWGAWGLALIGGAVTCAAVWLWPNPSTAPSEPPPSSSTSASPAPPPASSQRSPGESPGSSPLPLNPLR